MTPDEIGGLAKASIDRARAEGGQLQVSFTTVCLIVLTYTCELSPQHRLNAARALEDIASHLPDGEALMTRAADIIGDTGRALRMLGD